MSIHTEGQENSALHVLEQQLKLKDVSEAQARLDLADTLDNGKEILRVFIQEVNDGKYDDLIADSVLRRFFPEIIKRSQPIKKDEAWYWPGGELITVIKEVMLDTFRKLHPGIDIKIGNYFYSTHPLIIHFDQEITFDRLQAIVQQLEIKSAIAHFHQSLPESPHFEVEHGSVFQQLEALRGWAVNVNIGRKDGEEWTDSDFNLLFQLLIRVNNVLALCSSPQPQRPQLNEKQRKQIEKFIYTIDDSGKGFKMFLRERMGKELNPSWNEMIVRAEVLISKTKEMMKIQALL